MSNLWQFIKWQSIGWCCKANSIVFGVSIKWDFNWSEKCTAADKPVARLRTFFYSFCDKFSVWRRPLHNGLRQKNIRTHLIKCLEEGIMRPFPTVSKKRIPRCQSRYLRLSYTVIVECRMIKRVIDWRNAWCADIGFTDCAKIFQKRCSVQNVKTGFAAFANLSLWFLRTEAHWRHAS